MISLKVLISVIVLICVCVNNCLSVYVDLPNNAIIQEVNIGKNAVLKCISNQDRHYVFLFWQIQKHGIIIGPKNNYDKNKYDYDVVSGNLTIRVTTPADEGLYNCVSNGLDGKNFSVSSIKLKIHKDWEEVYEEDANINLLRACVALAIILGMLIVIYIILRAKQTHRKVQYSHFDDEGEEEEEDDSNEELFNRPSTSGKHHYIKNKQKHQTSTTDSTKSPDDFEKVYTTISMAEDV